MKTINYEEQAQKFMTKTKTEFSAKLLGNMPYFYEDTEPRDVYQITLKRGAKKYTFRFGQSIAHSRPYVENQADELENQGKLSYLRKQTYIRDNAKAPDAYQVLTALTKYDPGTFEDFCSEYGYSDDSRKAEKTYFAVQKEFANVKALFGDVMEELEEIQ